MMLDQLHVQPGNRILEIGAGTGYNAALLAQLTGRADLVTTIDIDPDVTEQAARALVAAGYGDVHVITGDGALGHPGHAPYDRLIATVSPWDISAAWWNQLADGARLIAPLRVLSSQRVAIVPDHVRELYPTWRNQRPHRQPPTQVPSTTSWDVRRVTGHYRFAWRRPATGDIRAVRQSCGAVK